MADTQKKEKENQNNVISESVSNDYSTTYSFSWDGLTPTGYENAFNYNDILIGDQNEVVNEEEKQQSQEQPEQQVQQDQVEQVKQDSDQNVEQRDENQEQVQQNDQNEDGLELNAEVKKYEQELSSTRSQLKQYLSKFPDDYLEKIRQTDYYKERLAYWKEFYAKRRQEAEVKDQENNLARREAMQENDELVNNNEDNKNVNDVVDNNAVNEEKDENKVADNVNNVDNTANNNAVNQNANNNEYITAYTSTVELDPIEIKNVNNISRADLFIEEIDNRIGKEQVVVNDQVVNASEEEQKQKTLELSQKINEYVAAILLDSMHDSLQSERDDIRKAVKKLTASEKQSTEYITDKYNEKYNLYSDALASFDNVVTKGRNESKRAAAQRQKDANTFTDKPNLLSANDMLVDNLRTTFVNQVSSYMTDRIISQIEAQNAQDSFVLTKASIKDLVSQIVAAGMPQFNELQEKIQQSSENRIKKLQEECDALKVKSKDKTLTDEEREQTKKQIAEKQNQIEYEKFNTKFVLVKQNKLLKKGSADYIMNQAFASEISKIMYQNSANKLNEYDISTEKTQQMASKIINVLDQSKDVQLNLRLKEVEKVEQNQQEEQKEQIENQQVQVEQNEQKVVEEEYPVAVYVKTLDEFAQERSDVLENLIAISKKFADYHKANNNEDYADYFKKEKNLLADEHLHWFGQVQGVKIKINKLERDGEKVPSDYWELYTEMYVSNDIAKSQLNVNKNKAYEIFMNVIGDAKNIDELKEKFKAFDTMALTASAFEAKANIKNLIGILEGEDQEKQQQYISDYKRYMLINSNDSYVAAIKNPEIKGSMQNLEDSKLKIIAYDDLRARDKEWIDILDMQVAQDSNVVLPKEQLSDELINETKDLLAKNEDYYQQQVGFEIDSIKASLDVMADNKEKLDKLEQAILKNKQKESDEVLG